MENIFFFLKVKNLFFMVKRCLETNTDVGVFFLLAKEQILYFCTHENRLPLFR